MCDDRKMSAAFVRMIFALWLLQPLACDFFLLLFCLGKNKINKHLMKSQFIGSVVFIAIFPISTQHVLFFLFLLLSPACSLYFQSNRQQTIFDLGSMHLERRHPALISKFHFNREKLTIKPKRLFSIFKFYLLQPHTHIIHSLLVDSAL